MQPILYKNVAYYVAMMDSSDGLFKNNMIQVTRQLKITTDQSSRWIRILYKYHEVNINEEADLFGTSLKINATGFYFPVP